MTRESVELLSFLALSGLTLLSALLVVTVRNLVHAGFWLLPCLIGVAGLYALLEAHLFVAVQILIYVGAILVLILFALMLTRDVMMPQEPQTNRLAPLAGLACGVALLVSAHILFRHSWSTTTALPAGPEEQTRALGAALIGRYALPFEAASVVLLASLIAAIVVARGPRAQLRASAGKEYAE